MNCSQTDQRVVRRVWHFVSKQWKQKAIHGSILLAFLLFIVFVAPSLERASERGALYSKPCVVSLPPETTDFVYNLDWVALTSGGTVLEIVGWAFVVGADTEVRSTYVVLDGAQRTYIFDTFPMPRYDVSDGYHFLSLNAERLGFYCRIRLKEIEKGCYRVGLYIEFAEGGAFGYADVAVAKATNSSSVEWLASHQVHLNHLGVSDAGSVKFHIDGLKELQRGGKRFVEINGWAFLWGQKARDCATYLVLESDTGCYAFETFRIYTWWVPAHFGIYDMDLDWAGFLARIPRDAIGDGRYRVGVYVRGQGDEGLARLDDGNRPIEVTLPLAR